MVCSTGPGSDDADWDDIRSNDVDGPVVASSGKRRLVPRRREACTASIGKTNLVAAGGKMFCCSQTPWIHDRHHAHRRPRGWGLLASTTSATRGPQLNGGNAGLYIAPTYCQLRYNKCPRRSLSGQRYSARNAGARSCDNHTTRASHSRLQSRVHEVAPVIT